MEFDPSNGRLAKFQSLQIKTHDGTYLAQQLVKDLIFPLTDLSLEQQEHLCKLALSEGFHDNEALKKYENYKRVRESRKVEKRNPDIFSKLNSYTVNQLKNQAIRFGLDPQNASGAPKMWNIKGTLGLQPTSAQDSREYEDILPLDILEAPIIDICIVQSGDVIPDGFYRLLKSPLNKKANLNSASGGNPIFLCIKKDLTGQLPPITNLLIIFPDRGEYVPPGYHTVQRGKMSCNLNVGTSAEHVYLCYKRDFLGNPITDIQLIFPTKGEDPPKSFSMIEKSMHGVPANINSGTNGIDAYLCYKQSLTRLWCLANEHDAERVSRIKSFHSEDTGDLETPGGSGK